MTANPVRRKLKEGKAVVGTWLNLGDPIAAEALAAPSLEPSDREFENAIQTIKRSAPKHGVPPGIHCGTVETLIRRIGEGWRLTGVLGNLRCMTAGAKAVRDAIKTE